MPYLFTISNNIPEYAKSRKVGSVPRRARQTEGRVGVYAQGAEQLE